MSVSANKPADAPGTPAGAGALYSAPVISIRELKTRCST